MILAFFVLKSTWHYTTSLLVWKYFLGDLVSEKWHIYNAIVENPSLGLANRFSFLHVSYFYMLDSGFLKSLQELHG